MRARIAAIGIICILLSTLIAGTAKAEESIKFFGYVTNEKGDPINNSCVTIFDQNHVFLGNTQTDAKGYYELNVPFYSSYNFYVEGKVCGSQSLSNYFPIRKQVSVAKFGDLRVDFRMKSVAYIIVHAYNSNGFPLSNKDFVATTTSKAFATDLNDIPYSAEFNSSQGASWESAIPTFLILLQTRYKIHILWEVPGFGRIMLPADNEGKGYSVDKQGSQLTINFNYEAAKSKIAILQRDYDLLKSQGYKITDSVVEGLNSGKEHLRTAEKYLIQALGLDMKLAVAELNLSLRDSLWAHEQLYLDRAKTDIEKYRKGDVMIKVMGEGGTPIGDSKVSFQQTSRDFLFAVAASPHDSKPKYRDLLKQAGINCIYSYFSYGAIEPEPGRFVWGPKDNEVNARLSEGFRLIGMLSWLFYRAPWDTSGQSCPKYLDNMSFEEVKKNVYQHNYALAQRYRGKIDVWEAIAEPCVFNQFGWTWNQRFELYKTATTAIIDANPEAKIRTWNPSLSYLMHWSYQPDELDLDKEAEGLPLGNVSKGIPYQDFIRLALEKGVPIDIIDLHLINSGVDVYVQLRNIHPAVDLTSISNMIDQYSKFGKPVFFREHLAPSAQVEGSNWWHSPWDEQTQAEYVEKFYTLVFGKSLAEGIGWSTGFSDDVSEKYGCLSGGMLNVDLSPKLSYFALQNLMKFWTTAGNGTTNEKGELTFRGFAGDYDVTVQTADGRGFRTSLHVNERQTSEVTIKLPLTTPEVLKPVPSPEPTAMPTQPTVLPPAEKEPSSVGNGILPIAVVISGILVVGLLTFFVIKKRSS